MTIVILNDHAYGMIKWKQHHMGLSDFALDLQNPDFSLLAQAFGAQYLHVATAQEFSEKLAISMKQK